MKQIKFWLMAMLAIVAVGSLSSCSDKDKKEKEEEEDIKVETKSALIGEWMYTEEDNSSVYAEYLSFDEDGTYTWDAEYYDTRESEEYGESGTYTISGKNVTLKCKSIYGGEGVISSKVGETNTLSWNVSGKKLTLSYGDESVTYQKY